MIHAATSAAGGAPPVQAPSLKGRSPHMRLMYVGIDLHKRYMQTAVIDDEDNIAEQRIPTDRNNSRLDA